MMMRWLKDIVVFTYLVLSLIAMAHQSIQHTIGGWSFSLFHLIMMIAGFVALFRVWSLYQVMGRVIVIKYPKPSKQQAEDIKHQLEKHFKELEDKDETK